MIGQFPLWLVLAAWVLQRRGRARVTTYTRAEYLRRKAAFDGLRGCLPVPENRAEAWMTERIVTWLDKELNTLFFLQGIGLLATVEVPMRDGRVN